MSLDQLDLFAEIPNNEFSIFRDSSTILKTANGAFPNEHGVFDRGEGECFKWVDRKQSYVEICLLQLENGFWVHSVVANFPFCGFGSALSTNGFLYETRGLALIAAKEHLIRYLDRERLSAFKKPIANYLVALY